MSDIQSNTEKDKVLIFNPSGFILKILVSIALPVLMIFTFELEEFTFKGIMEIIVGMLLIFFMMYFIATVFGFALKVTGNYIVAFIVFAFLLAALWGVFMKLEEIFLKFGMVGEIILSVSLIALLVWPFIVDVKKAIIYYKYTV